MMFYLGCICWAFSIWTCILAAVLPETSQTTEENADQQCDGHSGTYYIHEYHVHGADAETSIKDSLNQRPFPQQQQQPCSEDLFNQTEYLADKALWLDKLRSADLQLTKERSNRLDMITQVLQLVSATSSTNLRQSDALRRLVQKWTQGTTIDYTSILEEIANITTPSAPVEGDPPTCEICNYTLPTDVEETLSKHRDYTKEVKEEMAKLRRRYLSSHKGYQRVLATTRELRRDLRSWEHRAGRLLRLYENLVGESDTGGESVTDQIRALSMRVWCLEQGETDPIKCPNIKPTSKTTTTTDRPVVPPLVERTTSATTKPAAIKETVDRGPPAAPLADAMVTAGINVSNWYISRLQSQRPKDCSDIDFWIQRRDPVQVIYLSEQTRAVKALCEEGWTVIMTNKPYGDNPLIWPHDRTKNWRDYKFGYGSFELDQFWFGNQYLYELTNQGDYQLRIDMIQSSNEVKIFTEYAFFRVMSEREGFQLQVGDNHGTAGDVLGVHSETSLDRLPFSTIDKHRGSLSNLIHYYSEGWWYPHIDVEQDQLGKPKPCFTHLTYQYPWICGSKGYQMISSVVMKIRPVQDNL